MKISNYSEKLKDPRWQRKRLEIMDRDNFRCSGCHDKNSTLHVHHIKYEKGKDPWDYDGSNLITLCKLCHDLAHGYNLGLIGISEGVWLDNFMSGEVDRGDGAITLNCPVCKFDYVHIENVSWDKENVIISLWCESFHQWDVRLDHHEGMTTINIDNVKDKMQEN